MPFWDAVLKVGGSLYGSGSLPGLMRELAAAARTRRLLVVPGGGPFADSVRRAGRRHALGMKAAHRMAILAMDQYGWLLSDLHPAAVPVRTLERARRVARSGRLPVLLASVVTAASDELPASWRVTSDSIAAWVARRAGARRLILVKSVNPSRSRGGRRSAEAAEDSPRRLAERGIVDPAFTEFARREIECRVVNGRRRGQVVRLLRRLGSLKVRRAASGPARRRGRPRASG
jgi:aspartokinase-like uncharacterized kinase